MNNNNNNNDHDDHDDNFERVGRFRSNAKFKMAATF